MARLRSPDNTIAERFRQRPRGTIPQSVHAGQQPPNPKASPPIPPSASSQRNRDEQRRQESELQEPTVQPQRETQSQGRHPLYDGGSSAIADQARQTREAARQVEIVHGATITHVTHPGASPTQSPNDSGRRSGGRAAIESRISTRG